MDSGTSWENLTGALPVQTRQLAQAMAVDPTEPSSVYLALRGGALCQSDDAGDTWRVLDVEVGSVEDMKAVTA